MKQIQLTQGRVALIDDNDFELVSKYKWNALKIGNNFYAVTGLGKENGKWTTLYIHRLIMNPEKGMFVDHINGNGLDNRRENLRVCTHSENMRNRGKTKSSSSGYKGVFWYKNANKWRANISVNGKLKHLGYFDDKLAAHEAYCEAAKKYHKEFAHI